MVEQLELQFFAHGQMPSKAGTMNVEKICGTRYQLTYWNCVGCISAVGIYDLGKGVHLIDCKNPYDSATDRKVVEAMSKPSYFMENFFYDGKEEVPF